ncbi:MAG: NUDIX hydrolase [Bacteroidetes bacterium CG23_combo_of_CG06-09_8_20_14_all_32_9]|nr:MAG: NUDIX hydrolase [Bacteroidetes bacterium CG23_combo_of_CG06-09_8_20_14_all_32_9]
MNRKDLLKRFLPGFLPLFVFIAADEIWGTKVGLIVAVVFGVGQLIFTLIKEKRLDRFTLLDTLLIVLLGGISLAFDNDIFFKLKPGFIGAILCIILAISVFTPANIMFAMSKRYMGDVKFNKAQEKQMKQSLLLMFVIFSLHTALVIYSAFYMSKEAWAFISGGLFYILFGVYAVIEFVRAKLKKKKMLSEEWVPLVDKQGKIIGQAPRSAVHKDKSLLHPVVHLHVINKNGKILLQKRPVNKFIQPGKWDTPVGGHVSVNETIEQALRREVQEEIGIVLTNANPFAQYIWTSDVESELVFSYITFYDKPLFPNKNELDESKFWTLTEISQNLGRGIFTPNFEHEFKMLQEKIFKPQPNIKSKGKSKVQNKKWIMNKK